MLQLKNIKKSYTTGSFTQEALNGISLEFRKNEFVSILGPSGSGKTTFLNIIGGLDRYDDGDLIINNKSTKKFKDIDWDYYRNNCVGFIFQSYNLIPHITVLDNVEMGMTLSGISQRKRTKKAKELLKKVGLLEHAHKKPTQLSGGQMQRVAIARALANDPDIILADEPTGALDSTTSVQIMELIKEIAKDKLVIMVTHNPDLAKEYASRIVEFKDGEIIKDTNPIKKEEKNDTEFKIKKTAMKFTTALKLSFNNIRTKKGRTILTSLASSIGIIGIALILALSNGFKLQIDKFETDTLAQMPIVIQPEVVVADEEEQAEIMNSMMKDDDRSFTKEKKVYPLISMESLTHKNDLSLDYIDYLEKVNSSYIGGLSYIRSTNLNILYKNNNKVTNLQTGSLLFPLPESVDGKEDAVITDNFELIHGKFAEEKNELTLLVDTKNRLSYEVLEMLGYDKDDVVSFDELLNKEFKVVLDKDFYQKAGNIFMVDTDYEKLYKDNDNVTLKITGIIRGKKGNKFAQFSGTGLCYKETLMDYIMEENNTSDVVKKQREADYSVLTGKKIDLTTEEGKTEKSNLLGYLGAKEAPMVIQIYPKDFDSKEKLLKYLDDYNKGKEEEDKIIYTDYAEAITSLSGGIMDAVTVVLIAFSSISLIVSSIMIGIIMYISVLERTKEIGILRALGARKKDIRRVFNAETFIIGISSGLLGILIAELLTIPANSIIYSLTELENVAKLNPIHAIVLITISVILTVIGGYIPAKVASKKDPVEALRNE